MISTIKQILTDVNNLSSKGNCKEDHDSQKCITSGTCHCVFVLDLDDNPDRPLGRPAPVVNSSTLVSTTIFCGHVIYPEDIRQDFFLSTRQAASLTKDFSQLCKVYQWLISVNFVRPCRDLTGRVQRTVAGEDPDVVHVRVISSPGLADRMEGVAE